MQATRLCPPGTSGDLSKHGMKSRALHLDGRPVWSLHKVSALHSASRARRELGTSDCWPHGSLRDLLVVQTGAFHVNSFIVLSAHRGLPWRRAELQPVCPPRAVPKRVSAKGKWFCLLAPWLGIHFAVCSSHEYGPRVLLSQTNRSLALTH